MKQKINLTPDEFNKIFLNAKSLLDAGFKGNRLELWDKAQTVLPPERQRHPISLYVISKIQKNFKHWSNPQAATREVPRTKRKYTHRLHPQPSPASLPGNYCPCCGAERTKCSQCGFDFRTITIV